MPGKRFNLQAQELGLKLLHYFEEEKANKGPLIPVNAVYERVAVALGISIKFVSTIKQWKEQDPVLRSPGKNRPRRKSKTCDLPENTKIEVQNTIYDMYSQSN